MTQALRAEWAKYRTLRFSWLLPLGVVIATAGLGVAIAAGRRYVTGSLEDTTQLSLTGLYLGQALAATLGVLVFGAEYADGMILVSLAAVPRRMTLFIAKTVLVVALALVSGGLAALTSVLAAAPILAGHGFDPVHGYATLSLAHGPTLRAAAGTAAYLVLVALLGLGVAAAVRDSAGAVGIVLGLLYVFPVVAGLVSNPAWQRRLEEIGPSTAGMYVQATVGIRDLPLSPLEGLGVLAAWAAAGLVVGSIVLARRDA